MGVPLFVRVLPAYLLIASIFIVPVWQKQKAEAAIVNASLKAQAEINSRQEQEAKFISGTPNRIIIPRLAIDLAIVNGEYDASNVEWSVAPSTANFASNTAKTNNRKDKSLIYGHWTTRVFGKTKDLQEGDEVFIGTDNGHTFKYTFSHKIVVAPTYTKLFDDLVGDAGLAVMTCQGTWAQERRIMFFKLENAI